MYVGTYLDRQNNLLYVSERINGNRVTTTYPLIYEYLVPDDNGYDMGIDGQRLSIVILVLIENNVKNRVLEHMK